MEYMQITLDQWVGMKEQLKQELTGVSEGFVRIGYLLRQIEERRLYEKDGYKSIAEFAKVEYGLESSTVSRFININKKYSINGNSDRLRTEFAKLGSSKLGEMLSLPDSDLQMIEPAMTREGIRELKSFNKTEPTEGKEDLLTDLIEQYFEANKEILNNLYSSEAMETGDIQEMIDITNPSGNKVFRKGFYLMMMYEGDIKIKKYGVKEPITLSWVEFFSYTRHIFEASAAGKKTYQKHFEKAEKIAPAQIGVDIGNPICEKDLELEEKRQSKEEKEPVKVRDSKEDYERNRKGEVIAGVKEKLLDVKQAETAAKKDLPGAEIEAHPNYISEEKGEEIAPAQIGADIGNPICQSDLGGKELEERIGNLIIDIGRDAGRRNWQLLKRNIEILKEMVEKILGENKGM